MRGLRKKVLLRKAVAPLVPGADRARARSAASRSRRRPGCAASSSRSRARRSRAETLRRQGFFRPEAVDALLDRHVAGREDLSRQLWGLLAFTLWHERHVEREPGPLREPQLDAARRVNVWIDMTAPAHVLVFRPLIAILRGRGDEVEITARDYAQTLQLLELHGLEADVLGRHGGRSRLGKAAR